MVAKRYGEVDNPPFRTQRLFTENGQWYFDTREGTQVGPYHDINEVKKALAVFLAQRLLIAQSNRDSDESFMPGSQDGIEYMVKELFDYYLEYKSKGQTAALLWGNQRLRELLRSGEDLAGCSARMDAIRYAINLES
ncbi:MAG: DUF6316 family protein [Candidatus Thiodiazotropha sp.]